METVRYSNGLGVALGGAHLSPTLVGDTCFNDYPPRQRERERKGDGSNHHLSCTTSNYRSRRKRTILLGIIPEVDFSINRIFELPEKTFFY